MTDVRPIATTTGTLIRRRKIRTPKIAKVNILVITYENAKGNKKGDH
jgi:hypothetical protein